MHQLKKVIQTSTIFILFFFLLGLNVYADSLNITKPLSNEFFTVGLVDTQIQISGADYDVCYYTLNYTSNKYNLTCYETDKKIAIAKDGKVNFTVYYQSTSLSKNINRSIIFEVNRNLTTGKGYILFALIMFPMLVVFVLMYLSSKFDSTHKPLKYFLMFASLSFVFVSYLVNMYVIENFIHSPELLRLFNTQIYGWIYFIIVCYFMIYWTSQVLMYMKKIKQSKQDGDEQLEY